MSQKKQEIASLKKKLSPVLEKLIGMVKLNKSYFYLESIGHLIVVKPEDPVAYMLHFLEKQIGIETK